MSSDDGLFRALLDAAPSGLAVIGPDQTFRVWNDAAERITGWPADRVVGHPDPTVAPEHRRSIARILDRWLTHPEEAVRVTLRRRRPDGTPLRLTVDAVGPVQLADGTGLLMWFTEATDLDALLSERNRLTQRLAGATRIEDVVEVLTHAVHGLLDASGAVVLRRCPQWEHLHGMRGLGMPTETAEQVRLELDAGAPWARATEGDLVDGTLDVGGGPVPTTFVPMGPTGDGWVLAVCDARSAGRGPHLADLFRAVADEAWVALQRVALVTELDGKIEILEATNRLAGSVGLDLDDALAAVTEQSAEALSCERAAVYLVEPATGEVSLAHVHARDARPEELLAEADGLALAREVVDSGGEVLFQDVTACGIADGPWHADQGSVAVMGLPMQVGQRTVGALVVAHTIAHPRGFTSLCQQVGAAVSQQAALAVEHARLYAVERRNVQRLRDLDRMKADWMAGVTHDLKAPLTGLLGFVETLQRMSGQVSEEQQQEYLAVMARQAAQLVELVEDLLLSARVDAEAVARRRELVAVDEVVAGAVASLNPQERGRLEVHEGQVAPTVVGDASHLQRVFQNLLSNAWRHGGEHVAVTIGHDDGRVLVAVEDDGPGVPAGQRERVFERFVHGKHEASSGLGLYVARAIVEAHDGTIRVTDRLDGGAGARFEVRFPRGRPQREQDLERQAPVEERRGVGRPVRA